MEPDAVMYKDDIQYIIDAKYKSHMYNVHRVGEDLKDSFRKDLHQVLAYSSFVGNKEKYAMLIYPSDMFTIRRQKVTSSINGYTSNVFLVGIPLRKSDLEETKKNLSNIIRL